MTHPRHFLDLDQIDAGTLRGILDTAAALKRDLKGRDLKGRDPNGKGSKGRNGANGSAAAHGEPKPLAGKTLAMIFEKPSTRTRVSFEVGMKQLGGDVVILTKADMQSSRGETMADTARVLSRYVDAIMIRTDDAERLRELATHATVPVINGLTDRSHPCQLMADVMTFEEHRGPIGGRVVAWSGDGNNVAESWVHAAVRFGFELRMACPETLRPRESLIGWARGQGGRVAVLADPEAAVRGADCVVTDTWVSMNHGEAPVSRHNLLAPYRVDERLMALAGPDAIFMHCLPAHRGEEVTDAVIDGPRSVVWDEAENRLHAQKGILTWCMGQ